MSRLSIINECSIKAPTSSDTQGINAQQQTNDDSNETITDSELKLTREKIK
jgi:hypothetical protein